MGKSLIQTTTLTLINQAHNPRMHENVIVMIENSMHDHMITILQDPTQNFLQNNKTPKKIQQSKNLGL